MNNTIKDANDEHKRCQAEVAAFKKSGGKVTIGSNLISKIDKSPLNKHPITKPKKIVLTGMNPAEMVKAVLTHHKQLTRLQIVELTGLAAGTISNAATVLEEDGFLTRGPAGKGIGRQVLFSVVEK